MNPDPTSPAAKSCPRCHGGGLVQDQYTNGEWARSLSPCPECHAADATPAEGDDSDEAGIAWPQPKVVATYKAVPAEKYDALQTEIADLREQLAATERERDLIDEQRDDFAQRCCELQERLVPAEAALDRVRGLPEKWEDEAEGRQGVGRAAYLNCAEELREAALENRNG